jgi:hypothetical protein
MGSITVSARHCSRRFLNAWGERVVFCVLILEGVVGVRQPVALMNGFKAHFCLEDGDCQIKDSSLLYPIWSSGCSVDLGSELAERDVHYYGPLVGVYYCICSSEELMSFLSCLVSILGSRHLDGVISKDSQEQPNQDGFKGSLMELLVRDYLRATQSSKVRSKLDLCHGS